MRLNARQEQMRPLDLKPGEFQLWCGNCGFKFPKNAAAVPECPDCRSRFVLIGRPEPSDCPEATPIV